LAFADAPEPRLSPTFKVQLPRREVPVRAPLSGWRQAAMVAYGLVAALVILWTLRDVSLPALDVSSPWTAVAAFAAVPATFGLAIAVSRWLPMRRGSTQPRMLAF
jgi:hypothetical protein